MSNTLPLEVQLEIVSSIEPDTPEDVDTLRTCSLVHRSWTSSSQTILFHSVTIAHHWEWARLFLLLKSAIHIRDLIELLTVCCSRPFSSLRHRVYHLFPRVTSLSFKNSEFDIALVAQLPALQHLEMYWCNRLYESNSSLVIYAPRIVRLRGIDIVQDNGFIEILDCAQNSLDLSGLTTFAVTLGDNLVSSHAFSFINAHGSLVEVTLRFSIWADFLELREHLHIEAPSLTTLILDCGSNAEVIPIALHLLKNSDFPNLRRIYFNFMSLGLSEPFELMESDHMREGSWMISTELAQQLGVVQVEFHSIHQVSGWQSFVSLFGEANRPDMVHVIPEGIIFV